MELSKINFEKEGLGSLVGSLEADVLDGLWHSGEKQSCRQVFDFVKKRNKVAYTTITVTLDRLYAKGLVEREIEKGKGGLKYRYGAKISTSCPSDLKAWVTLAIWKPLAFSVGSRVVVQYAILTRASLKPHIK